MKIHTYWWGAELYPENDTEWLAMKVLFSNVTDLGAYDRGEGDPPAVVFDEEHMAKRIRIDR